MSWPAFSTRSIRRAFPALSLALCLSALALAPGASADFGLTDFDGRVSAAPLPRPAPDPGDPTSPANFPPDLTQAGGHPYEAATAFMLRTEVTPEGDKSIRAEGGRFRNATVRLPEGFVGNPAAAPQCLNVRRIATVGDSDGPFDVEAFCPTSSIVGTVYTSIGYPSAIETKPSPLYSVEPPAGAAAAFAFDIESGTTVIQAKLREDDRYRVEAIVESLNDTLNVIGSEVVLWGNPADPSHDSARCGAMLPIGIEFIYPPLCAWAEGEPGGPGPATYPDRAFVTNPTACTATGVGLRTEIEVGAYNGASDAAGFESHRSPGYSLLNPVPASQWGPLQGPDGCEQVPFEPTAELQPTSDRADSPSGLEVELTVPSDDLEDPDKVAQSHLKKAVVTLPEGMTVSPSSAAGLGGCSSAQLAAETASSGPGAGCPLSSKIGSVEVDTPLLPLRNENGEAQRDAEGKVLPETLHGSVYLARQGDNPFGSLLSLYLVVKSPLRGIALKLPGRVDPDPRTGRLVATFDDNPQLPFSALRLELKSGSRAPLVTPAKCGSYAIETDLYPWARPAEPVHLTSTFEIAAGPGGAPCPPAERFDPGFAAGTVTPIAGEYSPLIVNASRPDGSQELTGLDLDLPPGLLGKLAGIPYCPEAAIAVAIGRGGLGEGARELTSPSCPAASQVGSVDVGAGPGPSPFHVPGRLYLAGPYKGAPLSMVAVTPALAGPFDLGAVVVRSALRVDPLTARISAVTDPLPRIIHGIPLKIRSISIVADRPRFTLNPTNCEPLSFSGLLSGTSASTLVANRFQVGACRALEFAPKLSLRFSGATKRSGNPAVTAVLTQPVGDNANIAATTVVLPKSQFIDNAHINNPCTRVQYNAGVCPANSILGTARAFTPLLDRPLEGPVYFRSNGGARELPDLVADLRGQIRIELVGFIDSVPSGRESSRVRTRFLGLPDAPVSRFVLRMYGGKKGLLENSTSLCRSSQRAVLKMRGHNGEARGSELRVPAGCGKKQRRR